MKISLNCKLDPQGAYGFIKPIADISNKLYIDVFRDTVALPYKNVKYHNSINKKNGIISQLSKFIKMLFVVTKNYQLAIGIYEIPHGLLAFLVGKLKRVPVVISIIGNPANEKLRKGFRKTTTHFMYKRIHAITVTGSKSKLFLIQSGINSERIFILPNSIDINEFKQHNIAKKEYDIISLGRMSPEKELINFVKVIEKIKLVKPNIKVAIAGKGPEEEKVKLIIEELNLKDNISMLGYVEDIAEFYNKSKVFLLTSRTEGLPRTILEAMSCGIPCVASNVGDMEDLIDDKINSFLIDDYRNLDEYVKKVLLLLDDKELYKRISEEAQIKVKINYSYEAATKVWEDIIKQTEII